MSSMGRTIGKVKPKIFYNRMQRMKISFILNFVVKLGVGLKLCNDNLVDNFAWLVSPKLCKRMVDDLVEEVWPIYLPHMRCEEKGDGLSIMCNYIFAPIIVLRTDNSLTATNFGYMKKVICLPITVICMYYAFFSIPRMLLHITTTV